MDLVGNPTCITLDGNVDFLGQSDTIRVDVYLNDAGVCWPVVNAVAWQRREGIETCPQC
mgnify:CR=1 FL=1